MKRIYCLVVLLCLAPISNSETGRLRVLAAGSLKAAMSDIAAGFETAARLKAQPGSSNSCSGRRVSKF